MLRPVQLPGDPEVADNPDMGIEDNNLLLHL